MVASSKVSFNVVLLHSFQVSKMGVTSILVDNGVNLEEFRSGLANFSRNNAPTNKKIEDYFGEKSEA